MRSLMFRLAAILLVLPLGAPAAAEETVWNRSCRFAVEVDGRPSDEAAVFERRGVADLLGRLSDGSWFLVLPVDQKVYSLSKDAVEEAADGRTVSLRGPIPDQGVNLTLTPSGLTFDVAGHWLRVIVAPPLLGDVTIEEFLGLCAEFQERERAYEPSRDRVRELASATQSLTIEVFFGSWCPHCQEVLPKLFKCLRLADNPKLQVKMIGLPRGFGTEPAVRAREVTRVPTIIVLNGENVELGRFSASEDTSIEDLLVRYVGG